MSRLFVKFCLNVSFCLFVKFCLSPPPPAADGLPLLRAGHRGRHRHPERGPEGDRGGGALHHMGGADGGGWGGEHFHTYQKYFFIILYNTALSIIWDLVNQNQTNKSNNAPCCVIKQTARNRWGEPTSWSATIGGATFPDLLLFALTFFRQRLFYRISLFEPIFFKNCFYLSKVWICIMRMVINVSIYRHGNHRNCVYFCCSQSEVQSNHCLQAHRRTQTAAPRFQGACICTFSFYSKDCTYVALKAAYRLL